MRKNSHARFAFIYRGAQYRAWEFTLLIFVRLITLVAGLDPKDKIIYFFLCPSFSTKSDDQSRNLGHLHILTSLLWTIRKHFFIRIAHYASVCQAVFVKSQQKLYLLYSELYCIIKHVFTWLLSYYRIYLLIIGTVGMAAPDFAVNYKSAIYWKDGCSFDKETQYIFEVWKYV